MILKMIAMQHSCRSKASHFKMLLVNGLEGHTAICESLLKHNADADDGGDKVGWECPKK